MRGGRLLGHSKTLVRAIESVHFVRYYLVQSSPSGKQKGERSRAKPSLTDHPIANADPAGPVASSFL